MRTDMNMRARWRLSIAAVAAVWALSACGGGGGGEDAPEFAVAVKVDGAADASNPLVAGETTTIEVASGATLTFDSEGETRWTSTATSSTFDVDAFSFTSKTLTVNSPAGGRVVIEFIDKADTSKKATLTVNIAAHRYERVARVNGEISEWQYTQQDEGYPANITTGRQRVVMNEADGGYEIQRGPLDDTSPYERSNLFDAQDRSLGLRYLTFDYYCTNSVPVVSYDYPLHVGKAWAGQYERSCYMNGEVVGTEAMSFVRTVEAFERITVPAGAYDTLRIKRTDADGTRPSTCWWSVELGRDVKCVAVYASPDAPTETYTDVLTRYTR